MLSAEAFAVEEWHCYKLAGFILRRLAEMEGVSVILLGGCRSRSGRQASRFEIRWSARNLVSLSDRPSRRG